MKAVSGKSRWLYDEGHRLDASFHSSDGRFMARKFQESKLPTEPLLTVTKKIFNGPRFARCYVDDKRRGLPFLSSSDILRTNLSNLKLLSKKHTKNLNNLLIYEGWILISCSGTIGNMAYCRQDMDQLSA
jgi:type I restriction enzyme S subunit